MAEQEFSRRRRRLMEAMGEHAVAVVPAAVEVTRSRDTEYPFRQDSDFHYLTGFPEPDALLVLLPGRAEGETVLFCRPRTRPWNSGPGAAWGRREHGPTTTWTRPGTWPSSTSACPNCWRAARACTAPWGAARPLTSACCNGSRHCASGRGPEPALQAAFSISSSRCTR